MFEKYTTTAIWKVISCIDQRSACSAPVHRATSCTSAPPHYLYFFNCTFVCSRLSPSMNSRRLCLASLSNPSTAPRTFSSTSDRTPLPRKTSNGQDIILPKIMSQTFKSQSNSKNSFQNRFCFCLFKVGEGFHKGQKKEGAPTHPQVAAFHNRIPEGKKKK